MDNHVEINSSHFCVFNTIDDNRDIHVHVRKQTYKQLNRKQDQLCSHINRN